MVVFCLLSLLLPLSSVASFQFSNLAKIKGGQLYHLKHQRLPSVLFASIQEERKQPISNGNKLADNVNHHNHNNHHHQQHHQTSPLVIIQDKESQVKTHHKQLLQQTHHNDQLHIQHQTPTLLDLKDSDHHAHKSILSEISNQAPSSQQPQQQEKSYVLSMEEISPIFQWTNSKGKTKVLNLYGVYNILVIAATLPFWLLSMEVLQRLGDAIEGFDDNRAKFDYSGKIWCRTFLRLVDSYPEIAGDVSRLKDKKEGGYGGACLFVANHASFLDIAVLCTVLDPVFKFIAKDSLVKFPGVGKQLVGGDHILIDRNDKRSQLRSFKQAINYLKDGVPIMAFPEGARSPDGRLMAFKPGLFSMAVKAKVKIVPLSIANAHAVMPSEGFVPLQTGSGKLRVYVHDPIEVEGKSEEQISEEVRRALLTELPLDQQPLEEVVIS